ncbi:MAG: glycosyltransferase [Geobacter sp.]
MIIVRLIGGLGNQMFQYALGRTISLMHNVPLKLDVSEFASYKLRKYSLQHFDIVEKIATELDLRAFSSDAKPISVNNEVPYYLKPIVEQQGHNFDPNIFKLNPPAYLKGYWQSEKFFVSIKDIIKKDFTIKPFNSNYHKYLESQISSSDSIAIHIRRGDYVSNPETWSYHGVCPIEYYTDSLKLIECQIENPTIFVFSDDPAWVKLHIKFVYPTVYVESCGTEYDAIELWLISRCKHQIIANSTFSWWGAWLNTNPNKIVCAPERWFAIAHKNTDDLIPNDWQKVACKASRPDAVRFTDNNIVHPFDTAKDVSLYSSQSRTCTGLENINLSPRVSVIMSVYNGEKHVLGAMQSILHQTYSDFEFIIIDDASTDNTAVILDDVDDPRVRVFRNQSNIGLTRSLNKALKHSRGEFVARMDADDFSVPHRFETQVTYLEKNKSIAVVGSSYYMTDDDGVIKQLVDVITDAEAIKDDLIRQNWFGHGSVMMRKNCLESVGGYDEDFVYAQDYDLFLRLSEKFVVGNISDPLYFWRKSLSGISQQKEQEQKYFADWARKKAFYRRSSANIQELTPLVSVIVPTYNRPDMLKGAIQSILDQTFLDFEIIAVNDAGQDVSSVVRAFNSPKIFYHSHETNKGLAASRNTGIRTARGKYIAYLDDDDIFYPEHLATLVNFLQKNGESVAYTDAYRAHQYRQEDGTYVVTERDVPYSFDFNFKDILVGNYIPVTCFMHDIQCIHEAGYFDESLHSHEEWDLWIRMTQKFPFHHIKNITCEFRWREDGTSMTSSKEPEFISTQERIYIKYQHISSKLPGVARAQRRELYNRKKNAGVKVPVNCSIIIPVFNQVAYTKQCLEMLYTNTPEDLSFEVIIVDNASSDDTSEFLNAATQRYRKLRVIHNNENLLFAKACNQGAQAAGGEYLVFLNNDTEPLPGWLDNGLARLKSDPAIGGVGSKLLYPDGTIQHCGIEFARSGQKPPWPKHRFLYAAADDPRVNIAEKVSMVTGACLFISKELFHAIGGFSPDYGMYFEDIDLCMKIHKTGKTVWYEPLSVLVHHESKSSQLSREQLDSQCESASVIFFNRWLSEIKAPYNKNMFMVREESSIVFDGVIFQLQHGRPFGISRLWLSMLTELGKLPIGRRITLLDRAGTAPGIPGIRKRNIGAYTIGTAQNEAAVLDGLCAEEQAGLFLSTYYTYTTNTPALLMLYDMIPERFDIVGPNAPNPEWRDKYHAVTHATAFAAISASTARDLASYYPDVAMRPIAAVPCAVSEVFRLHSAEEIAAFKAASGITKPYFLLVGRRDQHKNVALFFQAFEKLSNRADYALVMAGTTQPLEPDLREMAGDAEGYAGFFTDEALSLVYSGALALVYPSRYEGFGLPILEAMQSGCPVITCQNSSIPEVAGSAALHVGEDSADEMLQALQAVQQPEVREYLVKRGQQRAAHFSWLDSTGRLLQLIEEVERSHD